MEQLSAHDAATLAVVIDKANARDIYHKEKEIVTKRKRIRLLKEQVEQSHQLVLRVVEMNSDLIAERDWLADQLDLYEKGGPSMATTRKAVKKSTKKVTRNIKRTR